MRHGERASGEHPGAERGHGVEAGFPRLPDQVAVRRLAHLGRDPLLQALEAEPGTLKAGFPFALRAFLGLGQDHLAARQRMDLGVALDLEAVLPLRTLEVLVVLGGGGRRGSGPTGHGIAGVLVALAALVDPRDVRPVDSRHLTALPVHVTIKLAAGRHKLILRVEAPKSEKPTLRVTVAKPNDSTAQFDIVGVQREQHSAPDVAETAGEYRQVALPGFLQHQREH